jgi:lipopolysaccharide exporter
MSKFLSNVIKLLSATLLGQILGIIASPILSRLYSPADFGIFQLFFSIVGMIAIISCFSYNNAINLPKKDDDAANIVILCLCLIIIVSIISTVFFLIFSKDIEILLKAPGLSDYLFLLPLAIFANSVAYVFGFWLSRREQFGVMAKGNFYSSITGKASSIGLGLVSPTPFGLIFGTIVNDGTIALISFRKILTDFQIFRGVSFKKIRQVAIRYKKFPQYSAASNLTNTAATQAIPFILAFTFSPIVVGYYAMAQLIIRLPSKLMGNSLSSVFFQKACSEKNQSGSITSVVKSVHTRLTSYGIFICIVIIIIGPELFSFFLGSQWLTAGIYAQVLAPWFFVAFISTPLFAIFSIFEKQGASLWFNVILLITRIVVIFIGGIFGNPLLGMVLLSSTGVLFWTWMNMYLLKIAGVPVKGAIIDIGKFLSLGLLVALPLIIAKFLSLSPKFLFIIAIIVTLVYYLIVIYHDPQLKDGLAKIITNIIPKKN